MDNKLDTCPACGSERIKKIGYSRSGYQRHICKICKKSWTGNKTGRPRKESKKK